MHVVGLVVFVVVQILFLPIALVGTIYLTVKTSVVSKRMGMSATATSVVGDRWTLDKLGQRPDAAAVRLYSALPNGSVLGMWSFLFPSWLRYRISGTAGLFAVPEPGKEHLAQVGLARTVRFDALIERARAGVDQFVLLGAGFDTRPYGPLKGSGMEFFELDMPGTVAAKRDALARAGIDTAQVAFVGVDFSAQGWGEALLAAGYDPDRPAVFLWEGVTLYLSEGDVRETLRQFRMLAPLGSVLLVDLYGTRDVKALGGVTAAAGEGMSFGLEFGGDPVAATRAFAESEGLALGEAHVMGDRTRHGAFGVIAELTIRPVLP
ncbi:class I SAM-dependent methyltransferase [Raineyella sp. W15-4]|uniref:class I SAM-dependent methyltransferase n=1 Tax=Raineyella sp. W15-4 TaxID=3081651 RepID=UPI002952B806|nr:class I SAM-dependent methyltransferase [Raineyella sp. W15-4]WOQ17544.1 class I SAM-dependent methyltransferase [Raineyella sp. W15-4]